MVKYKKLFNIPLVLSSLTYYKCVTSLDIDRLWVKKSIIFNELDYYANVKDNVFNSSSCFPKNKIKV